MSINDSLYAIQSQFQSLEALPQDVAMAMTREVLRPSGLTVPVLNYTPTGLVASIRAGGKATIVKISKSDRSWADTLSMMNPDRAWGFSLLFQQDTAQTVTAIFGNDFWFNYRSAIIKKAGERNEENTLKLVWACAAGDSLYWRMTSQVYMDAMENETDEVKVLCLAKKAQIAYSHSEMVLNLLKTVCHCETSIVVV